MVRIINKTDRPYWRVTNKFVSPLFFSEVKNFEASPDGFIFRSLLTGIRLVNVTISAMQIAKKTNTC